MRKKITVGQLDVLRWDLPEGPAKDRENNQQTGKGLKPVPPEKLENILEPYSAF
jgi:hypothetical protein